ncbi:hypothetical protein NE237_019972 [Protea cynaroides]|uniref:Uncharacterized protein n=1 Tax=Protea cynaroides TaxID=273540 RepID=A0A9Q0K266_9MAGN|nr:hypothetical protein NE237_019972 [Protea cynaroides]
MFHVQTLLSFNRLNSTILHPQASAIDHIHWVHVFFYIRRRRQLAYLCEPSPTFNIPATTIRKLLKFPSQKATTDGLHVQQGDYVDQFSNSLKETGRSTGYASAQRTELFVTTSVCLHGWPPPTLVSLYCSLSAIVSLAGDSHSNQLLSATQYHYSSTSHLFQKDGADENSTAVSKNLSESIIAFKLREPLVDRNKPLKPPNRNLISLISLKLSAISLLAVVSSLESCRGFLQCDNNAVNTVQFYKNVFRNRGAQAWFLYHPPPQQIRQSLITPSYSISVLSLSPEYRWSSVSDDRGEESQLVL